ncbi:TPA: thiol peroxidase [Streptococcus pneumoniae]|nr:thiol peroxidase [Streptococcus pneumoniae]
MVTFLGNPVSFTGKQLQVGDKALDFSLTTTDLSKKSLADFDGKKKVLSVVPSIDTGICSTQTRRFNEELDGLDNTVVLTVSMDLPFAQKRWCGNEWHLLARAVFVLDTDNTIRYVEYVDNINSEPNFESAIAAAKAL